MDRFLLAAAIVIVTAGVAMFMRYRSARRVSLSGSVSGKQASNGYTPSSHVPSGYIPSGIAMDDLVACGLAPPADAAAFIVVFTEATCRTCAAALQTANGPLGAGLTVIEVEYTAQSDLQKRLGIDTVPTTVLVANDGAVLAGWSGKIDEAELAAATQLATNR